MAARLASPTQRRSSLAQGFALVATLMALVAGAQALGALWPPRPRPPKPACAAAIEIAQGQEQPRLGCANELPARACPPARAGDRVVLRPGAHPGADATCHVQPDGMRAAWMLAWGLPLDINRRSAAELALVPGIGAGLAERIVAHRAQHGPFCQVEGLIAVRGVGPKSLRKLAPYLDARCAPDHALGPTGVLQPRPTAPL